MMQPRDAHDDGGDCAMMLHESAALSSNQRQQQQHNSLDATMTTVSGADPALVGARKRKALRVVKHQASPIKAEAELGDEPLALLSETQHNKTSEQGNTSMDTGVSSDLSESRPSLVEDDLDDELDEEESNESGGEFDERRRPTRRSNERDDRAPGSGGRKRQLDDHLDDSRCHTIAKQRITVDDAAMRSAQSTAAAAATATGSAHHHLKCPECGESFASRPHLIQHVQMAHPAALAYHAAMAAAAAAAAAAASNGSSGKDLADMPSILHLANAAAMAAAANPSGRPLNNLFAGLSVERDVTNAPADDEYKNEEDDPFSAVLREMKIKGEFPCRLCEAVFPNLRALKGHNRNHLTHAPYRCNMCPSTSQDKSALIRHMRTHNGERPYECRDCQYAFTTKANCERHLRNRHGKVDRQAVRASIIYHLSEDSGAQQRAPSDADASHNDSASVLDLSADGPDSSAFDERKPNTKTEDEELTDYPSDEENEQDGPLDLTVDVLDLRKRRQESLQIRTGSPAASATPVAPPADVKTSVFPPPYFGGPYPGLPFFYPGLGGASYSAFLESKLAEMGNPAVDLSALALAAVHHDAIRQVQKPPSSSPVARPPMEGLLVKKFAAAEEMRPAVAPPVPVAPVKVEKKPAVTAAAAALEPGVKMVLKNGVLVKKQKQRRYRTERPFGCEHCTARFTLRSNMERHIKQQHPDIWSTRPRGHRRAACTLPAKASPLPTMVDLKAHQALPAVQAPSGVAAAPEALSKDGKAPISEQVRQAVQMKIKKRRNSEHSEDEDEDDDDDVDEEEDEAALVIDEQKEAAARPEPVAADLASVSKLLNNAVAQSFQQYFNQHRDDNEDNQADKHHARSSSDGNTDEMDEGECTSISDGHSGGSDFGGNPSDGVTEGGKEKKKSAYSNAPHRVSCPYCSRKFPWTSSLRRHILTHTGQKPYKCPQCPLWFTTKSNCDRHLLRKHGNLIHGHSAAAPALPERFKCSLCPSLVFSTSENLKKHVDAKHCPGSPDSIGDDDKASRPASPSDGQSAEQLPYKCHLCDDHNGFAERQEVLDHLQFEHTDEFHDLVGKVGALVAEPPPMSNHTSDEGEDYDSVRGKFPDYANRKVICAFCLRRFWSAEDLRRHMRTHSGERPYQCEVCSRRFTLKHSMLRHRRKHGGVSQADESEEGSEDDEEESGSEHGRRRRSRKPQQQQPTDAAVAAAKAAKVRMQAVWSGAGPSPANRVAAAAAAAAALKLRGPCGSDLIGNLLGIQDTTLVEQLMSKPADDAARLLGVTGNRV